MVISQSTVQAARRNRRRRAAINSLAVFLCLLAALHAQAPISAADDIRWCDVEPTPGVPIIAGLRGGAGGMAGNGWDGPGQGAVTIFWHLEGSTTDLADCFSQRTAVITAMQAWADVVQITFQEVAVPNMNASVDWDFLVGDHSGVELQEAGDPDCPFDGPGGVLAHAGFPPGVATTCINPQAETFAGNVHFDDAEDWELDNEAGSGPFNLTYTACHEVGHSIGLTHSGDDDVMRATQSSDDSFEGLTANDIANVRAGYAAGMGAVITLNDTGIWVDRGFGGFECGIQSQPFNTVVEAVNAVPPSSTGIVVHVESGSYAETPTITRNMVLEAENGAVTLGL